MATHSHCVHAYIVNDKVSIDYGKVSCSSRPEANLATFWLAGRCLVIINATHTHMHTYTQHTHLTKPQSTGWYCLIIGSELIMAEIMFGNPLKFVRWVSYMVINCEAIHSRNGMSCTLFRYHHEYLLVYLGKAVPINLRNAKIIFFMHKFITCLTITAIFILFHGLTAQAVKVPRHLALQLV